MRSYHRKETITDKLVPTGIEVMWWKASHPSSPVMGCVPQKNVFDFIGSEK